VKELGPRRPQPPRLAYVTEQCVRARQHAPSAFACTRMATTLAVWYSAGSPPTTTTRAGRIHAALGVDPIHFEGGYPKLV
jgi:hypothetical protein